MLALRVVRAAVLTSVLAVAFLLLVVVGSAVATDGVAVSPSYSSSFAQMRLVGDGTAIVAQAETTQNTAAVVQKTGPAAATTLDLIVVAAFSSR